MRVEALRKTLIITALSRSTIIYLIEKDKVIKVRKRGKGRKIITVDQYKYKIKSSFIMRPEEISEQFANDEGHELYYKTNRMSQQITGNIIQRKLSSSQAPRVVRERAEAENDISKDKSQNEIPRVTVNEDSMDNINNNV